MDTGKYTNDAVNLLKQLIAVPSVSRNEDAVADIFVNRMVVDGLKPQRSKNNVWVIGQNYDSSKPTVLLNAHIDTVKPVASWTRDPFLPTTDGGKLFGLGSNDCGGGLVSLYEAFRIISSKRQSYNIVFLASAEEEVSGADGLSHALPLLPHVDVAIVGEPTGMQPAVAEKGLMVLDITAHGKSGHAARAEGVNAIYEALDDLLWLKNYHFCRVSDFLGETLMQATVINAGTQHNVVPDECRIVVDVRTNELYTNEEVFDIVSSHLKSDVKARSFRLRSSSIPLSHPLVSRLLSFGLRPFGSPTLSDQALMPFPSLKLGPGDSVRSHSADEFIMLSEISEAISLYVRLLDGTDI